MSILMGHYRHREFKIVQLDISEPLEINKKNLGGLKNPKITLGLQTLG
jgi:hypothetical protein